MPTTIDNNRVWHKDTLSLPYKNAIKVEDMHVAASYFHIFWGCQVTTNQCEHFNNILGAKISFKCETMYWGDVCPTRMIQIKNIEYVACCK